MDISMQSKLLRALQEKEIVRIGSNVPVKTDCRIIVATNRNLKEAVLKGTFRQDLYYRLFGLPIELPPLRERGNDIITLSKYFIEVFCAENDMQLKALSPEAAEVLRSYSFPGNIRELKSVIELAVTLTDGLVVSGENIILGNEALLAESIDKELTLREYDIRIVKKYLEKYGNNTKLVAEKLDIGVATIYRMLKENN
ncbi:MAG: sigma-54-dependent Fis family transcriptional regulator, partial [Prolixibacteraceae bacterium]|nr:sigma-54-dependent Fis family transcriptional regulator [Prolixibacteraceae bacterium]